MESFERAHIVKKYIKRKKSNYAKKNLKKMLQAYRLGNNEEIKKSAETSFSYESGDLISLSDYSELSVIKELNDSNITEAKFSGDDQLSNICDVVEMDTINTTTGSEEIKSLSPSFSSFISEKDSSYTNISSSVYDDTNSCSSSVSIASSLISRDSEDDVKASDFSTDDQFDADGSLAMKILEKLGKSSKDKCSDIIPAQDKKKKQTKSNKTQEQDELVRKLSHIQEVTDLESLNSTNSNADEHEEYIDDSDSNSPYVSISANDMNSYSLSDIVGDHVHPTTKNLPSDKQNIVHSNTFQNKSMMIDDEVGSLIPELDEELTIEDLNLESDSKESTQDNSPYDTVITDGVTDNESTDETTQPINVYYGNDCYIITLKHPSELYIHGKVNVSALGGKAEIFGYELKETPIKVYAPLCYYAHCLKTMGKKSTFGGLLGTLTSAGLSTPDAKDIVSTLGDCDAVICLQKLRSRTLEFVDNNFNVVDLFSKRNCIIPGFLEKACEHLGCALYLSPHKRLFEEKICWEQMVKCGMESQSRGIICGGKGTGKSTSLRYLVNRLIKNGPVLVIDLDPGQAEFTVPGNLSVVIVDKPLVGPNFTHLRKTERTLNIGMINVMDNPVRYTTAVNELFEYCHTNNYYQQLPWIVNTMGMCNQMGLKLITYIIAKLRPTFLYQIDSKAIKTKFEFELDSFRIKEVYETFAKDYLFRNTCVSNLDYTFIIERAPELAAPQKSGNKPLTPKDERYLNVLAYFGFLLDMHRSQGLLDIVPYEVNLHNLNVALNVKIPQEELTKVINGKIIALCQQSSGDKGKVFTLTDKPLLCHGHGLIRGVDVENRCLYVLTPVPMERLSLVDTISYSDWMPEVMGTERQLPAGTVVPYRTATINQHRLMSPPKRRFNPIQLLKMSRNA